MKLIVSEEVSHFLSESDAIKSRIEGLHVDDTTDSMEIADAIISLHAAYTSSMTVKYLDPKTEIRVPLLLLFHLVLHSSSHPLSRLASRRSPQSLSPRLPRRVRRSSLLSPSANYPSIPSLSEDLPPTSLFSLPEQQFAQFTSQLTHVVSLLTRVSTSLHTSDSSLHSTVQVSPRSLHSP